jgi:hypothetical protein
MYIIRTISDNKSDFGVELMEKMLVSVVNTINVFRKSYFAFISRIDDKEIGKIVKEQERKEAGEKLDKVISGKE